MRRNSKQVKKTKLICGTIITVLFIVMIVLVMVFFNHSSIETIKSLY